MLLTISYLRSISQILLIIPHRERYKSNTYVLGPPNTTIIPLEMGYDMISVSFKTIDLHVSQSRPVVNNGQTDHSFHQRLICTERP